MRAADAKRKKKFVRELKRESRFLRGASFFQASRLE